MHTTVFGMRDVEQGDTVLSTENGFLLRNGNTDLYLRFKDLREYADWLDRNAEHLGDPQMARMVAKGLLDQLQHTKNKPKSLWSKLTE